MVCMNYKSSTMSILDCELPRLWPLCPGGSPKEETQAREAGG